MERYHQKTALLPAEAVILKGATAGARGQSRRIHGSPATDAGKHWTCLVLGGQDVSHCMWGLPLFTTITMSLFFLRLQVH